MRILKIELQNINSLKSAEPIVVDFEGSQFRDVGLYAITGSTGAGKTTILDAVTIALYHNVPRFNKSNIRAGLIDVVSYGADQAMARVTFENKGVRYESQWNLRLISKRGKRLTEPKEEVRLKNLDTKKIIAEKKRELQSEIENITQLNYNQFLRSAMLAQGEFAAFLSADNKEKGNLLEQITGEEIYKKIGEAINQRIFEERGVLGKITAKINSEDLLSDEDRNALKTEQATLTERINILAKELKVLDKIMSWFTKKEELELNKTQLEKDWEQLEKRKAGHQPKLAALELNEKAEPYKDALRDIERIEKEIEEKSSRENERKKEARTIEENLEEAVIQEAKSCQSHTRNEELLAQWMPKLDEVTAFDARILHLAETNTKTDLALKDLLATIGQIRESNTQKEKEEARATAELEVIGQFLEKNKVAPQLEKLLTGWSRSMELRKNNCKRITDSAQHISASEGEQKQTLNNLAEAKATFETERKTLTALNEAFDALSKQLQQLNIERLLSEQQQLQEKKTHTKELLDLSKSHVEILQRKGLVDQEKLELDKSIDLLNEKLNKLLPEIDVAQTSLDEAERILELERSIQSFEEERKKLREGEACNLCGATHHPYVTQYATIELSASQSRVEERKKRVDHLKATRHDGEIRMAGHKKQREGLLTNAAGFQKELELQQQQFVQTGTAFKINEAEDIAAELSRLETDHKKGDEKITASQALQKQKDEQGARQKEEQEKVTKLEKEIARLQEQASTYEKALTQSHDAFSVLKEETEAMEDDLNKELNAYGLSLPAPEGTDEFIGRIERGIASFNTKSKAQADLKHNITTLRLAIEIGVEQLNEKEIEMKKLERDFNGVVQELKDHKERRNSILPLEVSPHQKREALQHGLQSSKEKLEAIQESLNAFITKKATVEKELLNLEKDKGTQQAELKSKGVVLDEKTDQSAFKSRLEVEKALLSVADKVSYTNIKKQVDDTSIALKTLKDELEKSFDQQKKSKDFEMTFEEVRENKGGLEAEKEQLLKRSGEIKQKFELDQQIKNRNKSVYDEITIQEKALLKWTDLMTLLGGSKHAFNTYVQRLTLQQLILLANLHLGKLNPRYSLKMSEKYKAGEELNFHLIDHYQTDETRLVDTSSGGEKFIISLALALGLSDLASHNVSIESLFIDEGFGTLDNNTLETVISSLETLQSQGKMIGIISHVENLKERIPTQIKVIKKSNGVSVVEID